MFFKTNTFRQLKLKLTIAILVFTGLVIFMIYHVITLGKMARHQSEMVLLELGKKYEYEINIELEKTIALTEALSLSFTKYHEQSEFRTTAKKILKKVLSDNERLQSITLNFSVKPKITDSIAALFSFKDSLTDNLIRFNKLKEGIVEDFTRKEFSSTAVKVETEKVVNEGNVKILNAQIKTVDGNSVAVIPIVTGIYSGKQYLGYLVLHLSIAWNVDSRKKTISDEHEIESFVATGQGKVLAMNESGSLISEPLTKLCLTCEGLVVKRGSEYNVRSDYSYLTLCYPMELTNSVEQWSICLRGLKSDLYEKIGYNPYYSWLIFILICAFSLAAIFMFIEKSEEFWNELFQLAGHILKGDLRAEQYENEYFSGTNAGLLKLQLFKMAKITNSLIFQSRNAIAGKKNEDFDSELLNYELVSSTDQLINSLSEKKELLDKTQQELNQIKQFNLGQEKISQNLQLHYNDLNELSENIIKSLVDILEISMGAVFLVKEENDKSTLELVVSYAYSENRYQKRIFNFGESLVGACAAEKRTIHLKKIPENYLTIMSGLGLASPKSLLIFPLIFESKVLGVMELGSLNDFTDYQMRFTEVAALNIANTLSLTKNNIVNSELLEKTRLQTIELKERDKRTNEALSRIQDLHERTARSEETVRAKLEAMNNTLMMVEYTTQGVVIDANYKFLNAMHYSIEEIRGNNVLDLLKEEEREELLKIIESVKVGNFFEGTIQRHTKLGHEKWFLATYTPVYNDLGEVETILFFAVDITRLKLKEGQLDKKAKELSQQVESLRNLLNK